MDINVHAHKGRLPRPLPQHSQTITHITVLLFITLALFTFVSAFWSSATFAEALFFLELKGLADAHHCALTQIIGEFIVMHAPVPGLWPLRLAAAAGAFAVLLCTYFGAKKMYDAQTAFLAALVLATIPLFARFAIQTLPGMWFAVLANIPAVLWVTAHQNRPLAWWRWLGIWLGLVLGFLCFGFSALYIFIIFAVFNFVALICKRQPFFNRRFGALLIIFAFTAAALMAAALLKEIPAGVDLKQACLSFQGIKGIVALSWSRLCLWLLDYTGVWLLALAVTGGWLVVRVVRRKAVGQPKACLLTVWFVAMLVPALISGYNNAGLYLNALPPLAIFTAYYLNCYARYKNAQHHIRRELKGNAITLKLLLFIWGALICAAGVILFFNLETAWQRELYFETRHLTILIITGLFIVYLGIRSFWIVSRAYAYWGFIIVMLLSFNFIGNAALKPARDILHTSFYFNRNLAALYPEVMTGGLTVTLAADMSPPEMRARYFLYADFPVNFKVVAAEDFASTTPVLPAKFAVDSHTLASWGRAPYEAGYRPVYWEDVDGSLLIVFEYADAPADAAANETILAAAENERGIWPAGFCYSGGYLAAYQSSVAKRDGAPQITFLPRQNLRLFNVSVEEGLRDPYIFRWLIMAGRAAPKGAYTGLAVHYQTPYINKHWPYSAEFQKWALTGILENMQPGFMTFTGLVPEHNRTRRVLGKILPADNILPVANKAVLDKIIFEKYDDTAFLRFFIGDFPQLSLEQRLTHRF